MKKSFTLIHFYGRQLLSLVLLLAGAQMLSAQIRVTGRVTDAADGSGLIGVTVREKGGTAGTSTDVDGNFTITAGTDATLQFTYTGYALKEVPVEGRTILNVTLGEDPFTLEQVVVVGYGTQKKSDLTGAVGTVKSKDIERIASPSIDQALQGKIAGVYVTPTSGEPGAGATIRIRGTGTLNNANPLYVIDGMISYDASFINPQDVASIEVLKDASSAAIYGARGSNGVIIITTKNGKQRKDALISFNSYYGTQQVTKKIDLMNAAEFGQVYNEFTNSTYFPSPASLGEGTDWQGEIFRNAPIANFQLAANGGGERFSYNASVNYFNQSGILKNAEFERITARLNTENKLNSWFTLGTNLAYSNSKKQLAPTGVIGSAYRISPVLTPTDSLGKFTDPTSPYGLAIANPVADLFYKSNNHETGDRFFGSVYGNIKFGKYLTFRSNYGFDLNGVKKKDYTPVFRVSNSQLLNDDRLYVENTQDRRWIWEQTLTFDKEWEKHHLNVLAGYTAEEYRFDKINAVRTDFPGTGDDLLFLIESGDDPTQTGGGRSYDEALISQLFRVNYSYLDRYLLTFSTRIDQSSRFRKDLRRKIFPSGSVGWNIGQEPFVQNLRIFDRLKLRASFGILGNQNSLASVRYPTLGTIQSGLYAIFGPDEALNQGATLVNYANPDLKWETAQQTDIGLEFGFFKGQLTGEVDWYNRFTYDIIAAVPIPDYVGSGSNPLVNTAQVRNIGWDITLNWRHSAPFSWNVGAIFSPVQNEIVKLNEQRPEIFSSFVQGEPATRSAVGLPIGAFYGYQVAGIFQTEADLTTYPRFGNEGLGDLRFADINGRDASGNLTGQPDGALTNDDRTYLGSPIPTLTYSFNAGAEWKGFDIAADLLGVRGNQVFNAKKTFRFSVYNWEASEYAGRWTPENPNATTPRITNGGSNYRVSDYFLEDGRFVRLRSVLIGYSLPSSWLQHAKINKFRVYVSGMNLWTSQKYSGYSPEFSNNENAFQVGFDNVSFPIAKSWQVGVDMTF